jgi:hypothetical protein
MNKNENTYLLFIFAKFEEGSKLLREIPIQLIPISSSKYLKFNYGESNIICNFESNLPFSELREFVEIALAGIVDQWFLIEHSDNMAVHMDNSLKLNLFDLNSDNRNIDNTDKMSDKAGEEEMFKVMDYFLTQAMKDVENFEVNPMFMEDDDEDPLITKLKLKKNPKYTKPTLDTLLEKVKEKGIESLTKYEKQLLDEYARN